MKPSSSYDFLLPKTQRINELALDVDQRNNIHAVYGDYRTNVEGVFAGGDCRRGQSLVVWAINEGRGVADACNQYLRQMRDSDTSEDDIAHASGTFHNLSSLSPKM